MMTADKIPASAPKDADLDPNSLAAIRDLLAAEDNVGAQPAPEGKARKAATPRPKRPTMKKRATAPRHDRAASAAETPSAPMPEPKPRAKMRAPKAEGTGLVSRLKAYRPTPKHIFFAAVVLLLVLRPWLVFGLLFLSAFILTGIFLILGYDGFWRRIMSVARWYARRHPSRSAEVHRKLDGFAMRFDAFLDRFPEGSVDGLYLPDFGDLAQEEARHDEALDRRFDSLRQSEA